jgi:hypothetical protein
MAACELLNVSKDFAFLLTILPDGWREKAKETGALRRCRKVPDAETLLRILLLHLAEGCSLRETAVRVRRAGLADLSDVAIMDRLRVSGDWFRWMSTELMKRWIDRLPESVFGDRWRVRITDATRVKEPGPTGSSWCIHYCIDLPALCCSEMQVLDSTGNGETFRRFTVTRNDLLLGDRVYGTPPSIAHVIDGSGDVLVRFAWNLLPLWETEDCRFDLVQHLRTLHGTAVGDWDVLVKRGDKTYKGRVCAIRKSRQAAEKAKQQLRRAAQKHGSTTQEETLETAEFVFVFTSVAGESLSARDALEMYRGRWQIELVFKRLKSLIGFGHLRKKDPDGAKAWLHGKILIAFLIEALIRCGERFSPWGYGTPEAQTPKPMSVA